MSSHVFTLLLITSTKTVKSLNFSYYALINQHLLYFTTPLIVLQESLPILKTLRCQVLNSFNDQLTAFFFLQRQSVYTFTNND